MPGAQRENYAEKVYRAIEFIENHLTEPFTLEQVCSSAAVSKFYFARIFQATLGETVFDYARRRRLTEISRSCELSACVKIFRFPTPSRWKKSVTAFTDSLPPWNL